MFSLLSYAIAIFLYIFMRIKRDIMVLSLVGQEGTSISKLLSLGVILIVHFGLKPIIKKYKINKYVWLITLNFAWFISYAIEMKFFPLLTFNDFIVIELKSILKPFLLFFLPVNILIFMKWRPCFVKYYAVFLCTFIVLAFIINKYSLLQVSSNNIFFHLIRNVDAMSFYIFSEIFSFMISSQLWYLINRNYKYAKSNILIAGQVGLLLASLIYQFYPNISLTPMLILIPILFLTSLNFSNDMVSNQSEEAPKKEGEASSNLLLIPLCTLLCSITAGLADPYFKYNLVQCYGKSQYTRLIAMFWGLQSIVTIVFNYFLSRRTKFWSTSFTIIVFSLIIIILQMTGLPYFVHIIGLFILMFKVFKYSSHTPLKEDLLSNANNSLLMYDGLSSRFGKNITAVILSIIFIGGSSWHSISPYIPLLLLIIGIIWFIISYRMSEK